MNKKILTGLGIFLKSTLALILILVGATVITSNSNVLGGIRSFAIASGSMEPSVPVGSVIFTSPQKNYELNDLVVFEDINKRTIAHRINQTIMTNDIVSFKTKGDANNAADLDPVNSSSIKGKWIATIPYIGNLSQNLKTPTGFIIAIAIPAFIFMGFEIWNIKKEMEVQIEKKVRNEIAATP